MSWILQGTVTAASMGLGCGTCSGSGMSAFMFGYLTTHAENAKRSVRAFICFYLGKITAVCMICLASSILGSGILDENGCLPGVLRINVYIAADIGMIIIGAAMTVKWIADKRQSNCSSCRHCGGNFHNKPENKEVKAADPLNYAALWGMGAGYGMTPCAPLFMMAGYAATLPAVPAVLAGGVFALVSAVAPMIFVLFLSGILSLKLHREIPEYLDKFRLLSYLLLIGIFAADLFTRGPLW